MRVLYVFLFGTKGKKEDFVWNSIAGIINAAEAIVLMIVVSRLGNLVEVGYLSIAFAIGNLYITVGKFGVRTYQVTDDIGKTRFNSYRNARVLTTALMCICCAIHILYNGFRNGYSVDKYIVIICLCFIYVVEAYEDVYWGFLQSEGRLATGAKIFIIRWIAVLIGVPVLMFINVKLEIGLFISIVVSFFLFCICIKIVKKNYKLRSKFSFDTNTVAIITSCFPLAVAFFCQYYLCNASKYAIDRCLTDEIQAIFGYISMPVFVVQLINEFFYQPYLVDLGNLWKKNELNCLMKMIYRQLLFVAAITMICLLGAYICGIRILSIIYNIELEQYLLELLILLCGGGFLAIVTYFRNILTIFGERKYIFKVYVIITCICVASINYFVLHLKILGAAMIYLVMMSILSFILGIKVFSKISVMKGLTRI